jgi:Na+-transporting NADH:ubiquinone oxidoreductase subunit A
MQIVIKKGLDIPMGGKPVNWLSPLPKPSCVALSLDAFEEVRFRLLTKPGDVVKIGSPLAENKSIPGQFFVSPAAGVVTDIRRGLKRRLLSIVIQVADNEEFEDYGTLDPKKASREEILHHLNRGGIFPHIRMRPFDLVANRKDTPRDIFVKAVESLPYVPSAEYQVEGHENDFHIGLQTLKALTSGSVHLVFRRYSTCRAFHEAVGVEKHTVSGPHPASSSSVHIHHIHPIMKAEDIVWTLSTTDVIAVGKMMSKGHYHIDRVMSIAGTGLIHDRGGYFHGRAGFPIDSLISNKIPNLPVRLISGDPLTGHAVEPSDFMGFYDTSFGVIPENLKREPFHFLGFGFGKYSASKAYLSGHLRPPASGYDFTTNQHGEERPFVDGSIYNRVMPMRIPTMQLVKAIMAENFELAVTLGLLEVASEDFALPTFIDPCKIEMMEIVKQGLHRYSREMGY